MPTNTRRSAASRNQPSTAERLARGDGVEVTLPLLGHVRLPAAPHLAWYGGIALLAALEIIEWPMAAVVAVGKALADNRHSRTLQQFGDALEQAG